MSNYFFEVLRPGINTTYQDKGRFHMQHLGVTPGGCMDLENISKTLKIDKDEIINMHLNTDFFIYMVGFIPGHPFMGDLSSKLFLNRLKTPRVKIPPGSVGIVEKFCNIYPYESPGGWNIIGRTPTKLFNTKNELSPCLLSPGDSIKFKSITKKEFEKLSNE